MSDIHPYTLLPHELALVRNAFKQHPTQHVQLRVQVLLMLHAGHDITDIEHELSLSEQTITDWWDCWCADSLHWLLEMPEEVLLPERSAANHP